MGALSFGNAASVDVRLDEYVDKSEVMAAVNQIQWKAEETNISGKDNRANRKEYIICITSLST